MFIYRAPNLKKPRRPHTTGHRPHQHKTQVSSTVYSHIYVAYRVVQKMAQLVTDHRTKYRADCLAA